MEPTESLLLSLRGFSSPTFGKTINDDEIQRLIRRLRFKNRNTPIFHVRSILPYSTSKSLRNVLEWFGDLCSNIHFCRLWYTSSDHVLDAPFKATLQDLVISFDQELTQLESSLSNFVTYAQGKTDLKLPANLTVLRLYHAFRSFEPLFISVVSMIETYVSDMKYRRRNKRKNEAHAYHGCVGILSELELFQQKSCIAYDLDNSLLIDPNEKSANNKESSLFDSYQRGGRILSLRLFLPSLQQPLFSLFLNNMYSPLFQFILARTFQFTTKNNLSSAIADSEFFEYKVKQLSTWTPRRLILWAVTILLEYCRVDFDVLSRFRILSAQKENSAIISQASKRKGSAVVQRTHAKREEFDILDYSRMTSIFALKKQWSNVSKDSDGVVLRFLTTGNMRNSNTIALEVNKSASCFVDQHALVMRSQQQAAQQQQLLGKINHLLHFVLHQQQERKNPKKLRNLDYDESNSSSSTLQNEAMPVEQLWKHSFDLYPASVFHQLASLFEEVNTNIKQKAAAESVLSVSTKKEVAKSASASNISKVQQISFLHHSENMRRQVFAPLCDHLHLIKASAYRIIAKEFSLQHQLRFIQDVFLLGRIDLLQSFKELVLLLPVYHATEAATPYRQYNLQHVYQSQTQWQSLNFSLEHIIMEQKPCKGIQHFSVTIPSLAEAKRNRTSSYIRQSFDSFSTVAKSDTVFDESLLGYLIEHLRFEIHYQWPVSMLFPASYVQRLQHIFQVLLSMMSLKWLSEGWWKAIIPKGGLRQFHVLDRMRQKATDQQRKQAVHEANFGGTTGNKEFTRQPGDILQDMDADDAREEEERLKQAQRNCQQAFIQVMHLIQLLSGYYLSRVHERIWPDVTEKSFPYSEKQSDGDLDQDGSHTIEAVQLALRDGLEFIEDLLSIIEKPLLRLLECSLKAYQELRQALAVEYSHVPEEEDAVDYDDTEDEEDLDDNDIDKDYYAELQKQSLRNTQSSLPASKKLAAAKKIQQPRFSRKRLQKQIMMHREKVSRMLVAYRMAELAFEDVNQAREALMLAILSWRSSGQQSSSSSSANTPSISGSAVKRSNKAFAKTPQSAWKMQQMQLEAQNVRFRSLKQAGKRLFVDENTDEHDQQWDTIDEEEEADTLQRAYSINFLRCVEELQTQCSMLWTE